VQYNTCVIIDSSREYNVRVIEFKRPEYGVYSFVEDDGRTALEHWVDENEVPEIFWGALLGLLDIYESGGLRSIGMSIRDLGNGLYGLLIPRKGSAPWCPIFCAGPLDKETEITFLGAGEWDDRQKRVRPYRATGGAEDNLETLVGHPRRRKRE
jgi:hypothetical protein